MKARTALRLLLLVLAMAAFVSVASADVWLPSSLTAIESQAFMNASWLSGSCVIPDGTQSIGAQAFAGCTGITSLTIPDSVTYIGSGAFAGCTGLTGSVTIPEGCEVAADAFEGCTSLTVISNAADPSELFTWKTSNGEVTITGYKGDKTVTSVTVPAEIDGCPVTAIDAYVFSSSRYVTHITLPHTLRSIGNYAFAYCSRLTSVSMPISVTSVGRYAFYYSSALEGTFELIDATIPTNAFTGCMKLSVFAYTSNGDGTLTLSRYYGSQTDVTVPYRVDGQSVTVIGKEAFSYRTALVDVTLPQSITAINQSAFYYCTALSRVNISYGVVSIGPSAFYNCTSLSQVSLPESISSIGSMAFYNCTSLSGKFEFVNATINASAFDSCTGVEAWCYETTSNAEATLISCVSTASTIAIPAYVNDYVVTGMAPQAFYGCKSLSSISLPETFTEIPAEAFYRCTTLKSISIPSSIASIGEYAFYYCTGLESVTIPASVNSVGPQAFYGCTGLGSLTLQSGDTALKDYAFAGCSRLSSVVIPGDYSNVGNLSFNGTPWLNALIADVAIEVTEGCSSDYERALVLHDWLIYVTAYDTSYTHYGSEGVLFHGKGVCNSYALTYSRLLNAVGISNVTVSGTATDKNSGASGGHAWTLVQLDGEWYHVDTTWDDPLPDGRERHTYFCLNDAMMSVDHTWDTSDYPAANGTAYCSAGIATMALTDDEVTDESSDVTVVVGDDVMELPMEDDSSVDEPVCDDDNRDDRQDHGDRPRHQRDGKDKRR